MFDTKNDLERHMRKKKPCKPSEISISVGEFPCKYCKREFTREDNLKRHMDNPKLGCFHLHNQENLKSIIETTIDTKLDTKLGTKLKSITKNTVNQTVNQINIAKPGKEQIDHITREVLLELLNTYTFSDLCQELMKLTYFNKEVPNNSNWCIAYPINEQGALAFNHETQQFNRELTVEVIDDKFYNMMNLLNTIVSSIYDDPSIEKTEKQRKNCMRFFHFLGEDEISKKSAEIYEKIRKMAYNYKSIPMKSWNDKGLNANYLSIKFI